MPGRWRMAACGLCLALASGCAANHGRVAHRGTQAPGPASDPWAPYIHEASGRFGVPETWIRAVMRQESGGRQFIDGQQTTSAAGAMGLMQVVPDTYAGLRDRYGLGGDPYDPHDNIMAGAAYIREMYDRYGAPGFLAAYNAGPRRLDDYLATGAPLPEETVGYLASVAPRLGEGTPMTGPLASYAGRHGATYAEVAERPLPPILQQPSVPQPFVPPAAAPEPAFRPGPPLVASALAPIHPPAQPVSAPDAPHPPARFAAPVYAPAPTRSARAGSGGPGAAGGAWAIQVGAFNTPNLARDAADSARGRLGGGGETTVGVAARPGGGVLFRARVTGLSADAARAACTRLSSIREPCILVSPEGA